MPFQDWIWIRELEVDCVVGVYGHERTRVQPLRLQVGLCLDTEIAGKSERVRDSVDYEALTAQIAFLLTSCRFRMLETAAHVLCRYLLAPPAAGEGRAQIERVRLRLDKPGALDGVGVPALEVEREKSWVQLGLEHKPFGTVDVIQETRDAGVYRLNLSPGARIPLHVHRRMQESEMVLGKGLLCQGRPVAAGTVHRWPLGAAHCYDNPTRRVQSILCVDAPSFIESDEIPVDGEPAQVHPEGALQAKLRPEGAH